MDDLHNSLRSVIARSRAAHCVAFLANSAAIGCKKTPCAPSPSATTVSRGLCRSSSTAPLQNIERVGRRRLQSITPAANPRARAQPSGQRQAAMLCTPTRVRWPASLFFAQWAHMALAEGHRIKEARSADTAATGSAFSLISEVGRAVTQPQVDMP